MKCDICSKILAAFTGIHSWIDLGTADEVRRSRCQRHASLIANLFTNDTRAKNVTRYIAWRVHAASPVTISAELGTDTTPSIHSNSLYLASDGGDPRVIAGGQQLHPLWTSHRLPQRWKQVCDSKHEDSCRELPIKGFSGVRPMWLVDTWCQCLVPAPNRSSYVALSYVWGGKPSLQATKITLASLQEPGVLSQKRQGTAVAATIMDAMAWTEVLGERYLWVDSLCIVQDDASQKHGEIARMSAIYANASITIVAAQGLDANAGLGGLKGSTRPRAFMQTRHSLAQGIEILEIGSSSQMATPRPSKWATRGWTYQEYLFSRRMLVFEDDCIRWECRAAIWMEYAPETNQLRSLRLETSGLRGQAMFSSSVPDVLGLAEVVSDFNERSLTFPEDALFAFTGIASALVPAFAGGFISGLPQAFFDLALLWQPDVSVTRRETQSLSGDAACLPSWSWAGWQGRLSQSLWQPASDYVKWSSHLKVSLDMEKAFPCVQWYYHETLKDPGVRVEGSWFTYKQRYYNTRGRCPTDWTRHPATQADLERSTTYPPDAGQPPKWFYRHELEPGFEFWYPLPMHGSAIHETQSSFYARFISGRTRRSWLIGAERLGADLPIIAVQNQMGDQVGDLQLLEFPPLMKSGMAHGHELAGRKLEMIEMALGSCPAEDFSVLYALPTIEAQTRTTLDDESREMNPSDPGYWQWYYHVLWVEHQGDVAYRKGLGRVRKDAWEALELEEMDIILG